MCCVQAVNPVYWTIKSSPVYHPSSTHTNNVEQCETNMHTSLCHNNKTSMSAVHLLHNYISHTYRCILLIWINRLRRDDPAISGRVSASVFVCVSDKHNPPHQSSSTPNWALQIQPLAEILLWSWMMKTFAPFLCENNAARWGRFWGWRFVCSVEIFPHNRHQRRPSFSLSILPQTRPQTLPSDAHGAAHYNLSPVKQAVRLTSSANVSVYYLMQ